MRKGRNERNVRKGRKEIKNNGLNGGGRATRARGMAASRERGKFIGYGDRERRGTMAESASMG